MLLAIVYLIILVIGILGLFGDERIARYGGIAQWILFAIIGWMLFSGVWG